MCVYIYIYMYIVVVSYCLFSIKLAGPTAIVIHYFEYVISYKFYFILHLFSDSTSITIHHLLHPLSLLCDLSFGRLGLLPNQLFIFLC